MNCVINNGLSEASKEQLKHKTGEEIVDADIAQQMEKRFRCCWKQMVWRQEKTISLKDGMMPRKMQLSFRLKKMNKVPSRLKSVQLDITSIWSYNTSKWT